MLPRAQTVQQLLLLALRQRASLAVTSTTCSNLVSKTALLDHSVNRNLHVSHSCAKYDKFIEYYYDNKKVVPPTAQERLESARSEDLFSKAEEITKNKEMFFQVIDKYVEKDPVYRRGCVEFINVARKHMEEFGVHRDLESYTKLLDVFPKGKYIAETRWQVETFWYPKQQQCALDLCDQMEYHGLIPDRKFIKSLALTFGHLSKAFRKVRRMTYWMPKMKYSNPYLNRPDLPDNDEYMALYALKKMAVDGQTNFKLWKTVETEASPLEDTYIASAQSPKQQQLIDSHDIKKPLYVEGGDHIWVQRKHMLYFTLRADRDERKFDVENQENFKTAYKEAFEWENLLDEEKTMDDLKENLSEHEQEEGTILGLCITGTASKDSAVTWIRYLQDSNPKLEHIPIVFAIRTPESQVQTVEEEEKIIETVA